MSTPQVRPCRMPEVDGPFRGADAGALRPRAPAAVCGVTQSSPDPPSDKSGGTCDLTKSGGTLDLTSHARFKVTCTFHSLASF